MSNREVVVLSAVRSAVGTFGGSLSTLEPAELGGLVVKEAIAGVPNDVMGEGPIPPRPTSTAARSPSATRSARPAP